MIRGSIEHVTNDVIQGWIYSEDGNIRERTLLAFRGDACVGAGRVNMFRPDLADAGMGDGHLGFTFPISVPLQDIGSVVVKLEGSDAVLLQKSAVVTTTASSGKELGRTEVRERLASLKWALKHGRISQGDFDFLRILWSTGVYERGLVRRSSADDGALMEKPLGVATSLLEAYLQTEVQTSVERVRSADEFAAEAARLTKGEGAAPIFAAYTQERAILRVVEGSHIGDHAADADARAANFVDYALSPENFVVVDARARAEILLPEGGVLYMISAVPSLS
ncbi:MULTISPECIES: hypothetical protein [unclassified Aureimonas]|uniref:hypothetical protein n=1 Tax=unclassified Aureimonas TaxID=2615206 RepID=UPI0006F3253A|nr:MULTISPECIES: hypothetical protein [unclassified Aureimonas]KQT61268.1 hypothetical protein ASG54_24335 [Aureimonas sp. Leaf460]KQT68717.1 hypothetical protein ASG62_19095 [Aureimonas sp. Leaf427]